ncbi:TonB-dependent receptor [Pinibacter aurantiacus]|uniref:TonB-dependent receptor n=1 Tax=Pinibacter aurantiacus TaxID=2851599 RepID=A0A9E2W8T3_9BACT|nr:TonB-dependent receptor [Pinibacter aurantiacus]MBV4358652.1 TonB-dependent receptor [Pinibacter aurantiacus]
MRRIFFLLFLTAFSLTSFAGVIKGRIVSHETGEVLTGAVIQIEATHYTAVTGLDGSFTIKNIPAGNYNIKFSMVGYLAASQKMEVANDGVQSLNIELSTSRTTLSSVIVTAAKDKNGETGARSLERNANQVMNIMSARAIEVSPDMTVANVVQRISGVSIERNSNGDGQYAILRGMDKRYNYTLVNGIKIPSPDDKYRYVPLDIFPSDLLDRLEVYKSLTPSMEGDAVGGVVNMVMKDAPAHRLFTVNLAGSYSELFMDRDFMSYDAKGITSKSPYELHGEGYNATPQDFTKASSTYSWKKPMPGIIGGLTYGDRFMNNKLGVIVSGSLQNTYRGSNSLFYDGEMRDTVSGLMLTKMEERQYSEQQLRYGVHAKVDYRLNDRNSLSLYSGFMNLTNTQTRDQVEKELTIGGYDPVAGNATLSYSTRTRRTIQHIWSNTLHGDHKLSDKWQVDWTANYAKASSTRPDNTTISLHGVEENFVDTRTYVDKSSRRWEHNNDQDISGYLNFTFLQNIGNTRVDWKFGGLYRDKERDNFYDNYQLSPVNQYALYGKDFTDYNQIDWKVTTPQGAVASGQTYTASEKIAAGYLQFKAYLKKLEILGGVRVENTDQGYVMKYPIGEDNPVGNQKYTDFLPSINIKYMPWDKTNIRLSYFKSVNRPGFSEINPAPIVQEEYTEKGDPNLKHAVADNIDLRYEYFPKPAEQFMAGIFYKRIQNPIEYTLEAEMHGTYYVPGNFGNATNYGAELDWIKYFNKWGVKANYTYTHSSITTPKLKRVRDDSHNQDIYPINVDVTRPLYGQSEHIANLSLLYKDVHHGWDAQLAGSYTGPRIVTVGQFVGTDQWQKGFVQMDLSAEKSFKHLVVFAKANNLLNTPTVVFIKGTNVYNEGVPNQDLSSGETLIRRDYYQRSYVLGMRYKF